MAQAKKTDIQFLTETVIPKIEYSPITWGKFWPCGARDGVRKDGLPVHASCAKSDEKKFIRYNIDLQLSKMISYETLIIGSLQDQKLLNFTITTEEGVKLGNLFVFL